MTADVFVSYAREDLPRVEPLVSMLEAQGWSVFWDRQILPGQQWTTLIEEKLAAAKAVLVVWSANSVQSEWVKAEAMQARERNILVPVRIDAASIPLPFGLIQTADLAPDSRAGADETLHLLLTNLSRLIAQPVADTKAALGFAAAPAAEASSRIDWKHLLLELDGRINRKFFWIGVVILACGGFLLDFLSEAIIRVAKPEVPPNEASSQSAYFSFFVTLYLNIAVTVKRLHDFGWSGWWTAPLMVLSFIATMLSPLMLYGTTAEATGAVIFVLLFGLVPLVAVGLIPGTAQTNRYGAAPA